MAGRVRLLGAALVALSVALSACSPHHASPPAQQQPPTTQRSSSPALCPPTLSAPSPLDTPPTVPPGPIAVRLCAFARGSPTKNRPDTGVLLGYRPAGVLAYVVAHGRSASALAARCRATPPDLLLRFAYASGDDVSVAVTGYRCAQAIAYIGAQGRIVPQPVRDIVSADAGAYGLAGTGATAPELSGDTVAEARAAAGHAGFTLSFAGEAVEPAVAPGTMLFQDPPAGYSGIGNDLDVVIAAPPADACSFSQLAFSYRGGGLATGNDFGTIEMRDISTRPCTLTGPIVVTGLDRNGAPVTQTVTYSVAPDLTLTPDALPVPPHEQPPVGEVVAALMLAADYRDDSTSPNGLCDQHHITPASWRLESLRATVIVQNRDTSETSDVPSLVTCRGQMDTPSEIRAE